MAFGRSNSCRLWRKMKTHQVQEILYKSWKPKVILYLENPLFLKINSKSRVSTAVWTFPHSRIQVLSNIANLRRIRLNKVIWATIFQFYTVYLRVKHTKFPPMSSISGGRRNTRTSSNLSYICNKLNVWIQLLPNMNSHSTISCHLEKSFTNFFHLLSPHFCWKII